MKARSFARKLSAIYKKKGFFVSKHHQYPCGWLEGFVNFTVFQPNHFSLGFLLVGDGYDVLFWGEHARLLEMMVKE